MKFKQWLEAIQFTYTDPEDWEKAEEAEQVMNAARIRVDSTKELKWIALDNDTVVGALYAGWSSGEPYEGHRTMEFSFDVGVHPNYQGFSMIGPRLVDAGMRLYEEEKEAHAPYTLMKLRVINPKLAQYLESKYKWDDSYQAETETFLIKY